MIQVFKDPSHLPEERERNGDEAPPKIGEYYLRYLRGVRHSLHMYLTVYGIFRAACKCIQLGTEHASCPYLSLSFPRFSNTRRTSHQSPCRLGSNATTLSTSASICPADQRSIWDILWSCLATIFSCSWVPIFLAPMNLGGESSSITWNSCSGLWSLQKWSYFGHFDSG